MAADDKVVIGLIHGSDDPEAVLISYLLGVEALRAGKEALMWLTKDGVHVAIDGFSDGLSVPGARPSKISTPNTWRRAVASSRAPSVSRLAVSRRPCG
jgi:predicted peroxiredoxin